MNIKAFIALLIFISFMATSHLFAQNKFSFGVAYGSAFTLWDNADATVVQYPNLSTESGLFASYRFHPNFSFEMQFHTAVNRTEAVFLGDRKLKEIYLRMPLMIRLNSSKSDLNQRITWNTAFGMSPNLLASRYLTNLEKNQYFAQNGVSNAYLKLPIRVEVGMDFYNKKRYSPLYVGFFTESDFPRAYIRFKDGVVYSKYQLIGINVKLKLFPSQTTVSND